MATNHFKPVATFDIELSAPLACFTDPILKVERTSYPAPTEGALEYIIQAIYGHPPVRYMINRVKIMNPVKPYPIYMNECENIGVVDLETGEVYKPEYTSKDTPPTAFQRMTTYLANVRYEVNFTMYYDKDFYRRNGLPVKSGECAAKHIDTLRRRIKKGQSQYTPYMGLSECCCDFVESDGKGEADKSVNADYVSLYRVYHMDDYNSGTSFVHVKIKDGVLDFTKCIVLVGDKTMTREEFLNWRP